MAGLDANIILAGSGNIAPPPNPLTMAGQVAALQNARAQNQLLQNTNTEFQQKQAAGRIVANALMSRTDANGNVDYNGMRGDLAVQGHDNPAIAEALSQNLGQQGAQTANDTAFANLGVAKVGSYLAQAKAVSSAVAPLQAQKAPITTDQVSSTIAQLSGDPALHGEDSIATQGASLIANAPKNATPEQTDAYWRQTLGGVALKATDAVTQLSAYTGTPTAVNTGDKTVFLSNNPVTGTVTPMAGADGRPASVANQLSPGERAGLSMSRTTVFNPETQAPESVPTLSLTGKSAPAGPALGQAEAAAGNVQVGQRIVANAQGAPGRISAFQGVKAEIAGLPSTAFGPTGNLTSQVGKIAAAIGVAPPALVNGQASIDSVQKLLQQAANAQGQATGAGTDASRELVQHANPSLANSKEGLLRNMAIVEGNEYFAVAQNRAWQQWQQTHPASSAAQFQAAFNSKISPLVFQYQQMDAQGRKQLYNSLSKPEQNAFLRAQNFAQSQGWFSGQ